MCIFTGEEWWCLKEHVVDLETLYTRLKSFLRPIYQRILRICTMALFTITTTILFVFSFHVFFFNLVIPARSQALICTRKWNPEDSGRTSKMASSCQWPFSSFLPSSSLLKSSFYFNHSGTLQPSAVVSYDIVKIDKKTEPVRTATENRVWSLQKNGKFRNYQNFKDDYSFLSGDKILCFFYFDSYPSLGHLISRTLPINVIGYTNNSRVTFANRVSKMKKKQESLLQALIKRGMLLVATCCTRIFVSVISSCFV